MPRLDREVAILGTGSALPERRVTNADLAGMVRNYDASSGKFEIWVDRVTHIQERRFVDPAHENAGTLGLAAARRAIEAAGLAPSDIDHLIFCSFTYNDLFPGEHAWMVNQLGIDAGCFVMTAACAGSVWGLTLARSLVQSGQYDNVLVVGSECLSRVTNYADPLTAILFADAAGAAVVGRKKDGAETGFYGTSVLRTEYVTDAIHMWNGNCPTEKHMPAGLAVMQQDRSLLHMQGGPSVLRNAVNRMAASVVECLGFTKDDLKNDSPALREVLGRVMLVPHQANGRIVDSLQQRLGLDNDRVYRTIYFAGNSSAATTPFTLDYAVREGNLRRDEPPDGSHRLGAISPCGRRLEKGDLVVMTAIGAGYLYGSIAFVHAY